VKLQVKLPKVRNFSETIHLRKELELGSSSKSFIDGGNLCVYAVKEEGSESGDLFMLDLSKQ